MARGVTRQSEPEQELAQAVERLFRYRDCGNNGRLL
jgi:hypothetical protein